MELFERQQFDFFLAIGVERYAERLEQRNEGAAQALGRLRADCNGDGVWLNEFVDALFEDFLLSNAAGACFILRALHARRAPASFPAPGQTIEHLLLACAKAVFADLLCEKTEERLEQHASFQAVSTGAK